MARRNAWGVVVVTALIPTAALTAEPDATTGTAASASSLPPATAADSIERIPEQVVWLRSGAVVRGQLVEYQPGEKIVLQLATGEVRRIPWAEVSHASFIARGASPSSSAPAASQASSAPVVHKSVDGVVIGIHPPNPVLRLESRSTADVSEGWRMQCVAPCGKRIAVEDRRFRIAGDGLSPSNPFQVHADGKHASLFVSEGTQQAHSWGLGLLVSGAVLGLSSGAVYGAGRLEDDDTVVIAGLIGLGVGAAAVIGSVPLLARGRTTVRSGSGKHVALGQVPWPAF